jgi:hypothetical protein
MSDESRIYAVGAGAGRKDRMLLFAVFEVYGVYGVQPKYNTNMGSTIRVGSVRIDLHKGTDREFYR